MFISILFFSKVRFEFRRQREMEVEIEIRRKREIKRAREGVLLGIKSKFSQPEVFFSINIYICVSLQFCLCSISVC